MMDLLAILVRYIGVFGVILAPIFTTLFILQYRDTMRTPSRSRRRYARSALMSELVACAFLLALGLGLFAASFIPYQGA